MPRIAIPVTTIPREGIDIETELEVDSDASDDHYVDTGADGLTILIVRNSGAGPNTAQIPPSPTFTADGLNVDPLDIVVPAGDTFICGVYRTSTFSQDSPARNLYVDVAVDTELHFRAFRVELPS